MATRTITHFKVGAALFNDITAILFELPAKLSREILNRIDGKGGECEPIFKIDLKRAATPQIFKPSARKKRTRTVKKPPVRKKRARKKVAKPERRS